MSEMEEKLGAILSNPQMMQQIMSLAQAMNSSQNQSPGNSLDTAGTTDEHCIRPDATRPWQVRRR